MNPETAFAIRYNTADGLRAGRGVSRAVACAALGLTARELEAAEREFAQRLDAEVDDVLRDEDLRALLATRVRGDVIVLGDSIAAERLSWSRILARAAARAGNRGCRVLNYAVSGHTSTDLVARIAGASLPTAAAAIVAIGTNDAFAWAAVPDATRLSDDETARNLRLAGRLVAPSSERMLWLTPPVVDPVRTVVDPNLVAEGLVCHAPAFERKRELVRRHADCVDIAGDLPDLVLEPDGYHPTAADQARIARRIARGLGELRPSESRASFGT
jgi:acyl-CoA thioesterase-1